MSVQNRNNEFLVHETSMSISDSEMAAKKMGFQTEKSVCNNCLTDKTPLWRRDEHGSILCNACGLFLKLHGKPRPISLKTDIILKRNRKTPTGGPSKNSHDEMNGDEYGLIGERLQDYKRKLQPAEINVSLSKKFKVNELKKDETLIQNNDISHSDVATFIANDMTKPRLRPKLVAFGHSGMSAIKSTDLTESITVSDTSSSRSSSSNVSNRTSGSLDSNNTSLQNSTLDTRSLASLNLQRDQDPFVAKKHEVLKPNPILNKKHIDDVGRDSQDEKGLTIEKEKLSRIGHSNSINKLPGLRSLIRDVDNDDNNNRKNNNNNKTNSSNTSNNNNSNNIAFNKSASNISSDYIVDQSNKKLLDSKLLVHKESSSDKDLGSVIELGTNGNLNMTLKFQEEIIRLNSKVNELELITDLYKKYIFQLDKKCEELEEKLRSSNKSNTTETSSTNNERNENNENLRN